MQIIAKNLNFTYNRKTKFAKKALDNVSLTIDDGEFFGIIGHTGSGKSTFIQHLNALIPVESGELYVGDYNLSKSAKTEKKKLKELRAKVGMVFQYPEYQLFAETVYEDVAFGYRNFHNVKSGGKEEMIAVKEALELVGLDFLKTKDKSPFELSGGQKRRAAIAGVIVTKPEVLVLDEPVAGLDPLGKRELMRLLHELQKTCSPTVIIVSHDMDEVAENCSKVAVFSEGKAVACDTTENLFKNADMLIDLRLDVPVTGLVVKELKEKGINIETDFTDADFIDKIAAYYNKTKKDKTDAQ